MIPVKVLAARVLPNAPNALLGALDTKYPCLALLTTDCDDATYIALDEATKAARAEVVYGRSCYAGADNATQPNTGEVIGILGAETPGDAKSGFYIVGLHVRPQLPGSIEQIRGVHPAGEGQGRFGMGSEKFL